MNKKIRAGIMGILMICFVWSGITEEIYAKGALAYFGTEEGYEWKVGKKSPIGFYLVGEEEGDLTEAELVVNYDPDVLEFKSANDAGVTLVSDGKISIKQKGNLGSEFKQIVYFTPLVSTSTTIEITQATGKAEEESISTDTAVSTKVAIPLEEGCELRSIEIDGKKLAGFAAGIQSYDVAVANEVEQLAVTASVYDGTEVEISDTALAVGENQIYITTMNEKKQKARYTINVVREDVEAESDPNQGEDELNPVTVGETAAESVSVNGDIGEAEVITLNEVREESQNNLLLQNSVLSGTEGNLVADGEAVGNAELLAGEPFDTNRSSWKQDLLKLAVIFVTLLVIFEIGLWVIRIKKNKEKKLKKQQKLHTKNKEKKEEEQELFPVIIRAKNICMDFDRAVNEYTSIKYLAIQTVKGKRVKEKYRALNDISFEIHKGEVIGVIGTNGAGKSTLLKIIAGALRPTNGTVEVNQNKIQILTLGTGFDMELTGKENVYLNGAIIGYEKEFIDEHYDRIVEFAELQDFMDEKVKNYSSGMVSRLGFAIATVGDAAEILILDEVLSVGDRIFQKKSMKRIKEMIHSGSTVIMVSHSIKNITENCDRVIWIEKGHLIGMGDAKKMCAAYEKYNGDFERLMGNRECRSRLMEVHGNVHKG